MIPRLAAVYGALRGLGLSEERVEDCLKAIPDVELDSALEWVCEFVSTSHPCTRELIILLKLFLHSDDSELDFDNRRSIIYSK